MEYNEIEYGKLIYGNGFQGNNIEYDLKVLSKYMKHVLDLKKKDHVEELSRFCEKYIEDYNPVVYYKLFDKCIEFGRKGSNTPIVLNYVSVYLEDLDMIDSLDIADDYKKVLITMVVKKKISSKVHSKSSGFNKYFNGNRKSYRDLFNSSRIGSSYKMNDVITNLCREGVLESKMKGRVSMEFIDGYSPRIVFYELQSVDFCKIGWVWDLYKGQKNVTLCKNCSVLIKAKSNRTLYCSTCAREIQQEQKNKWKRENWNKEEK